MSFSTSPQTDRPCRKALRLGMDFPVAVRGPVDRNAFRRLTYNAISLIIPGAASIPATSAGDQATLVSLGGGNWQVATYTPASGAALINPAVNVATYQMTAAISPASSKYSL